VFCLIVSFQVGMSSSPEPAEMDLLAEQSAASSPPANLTLLYPSTNMATYDKSEALCGLVASGLRLSPLVPFADNSHNLSNYSQGDDRNASIPFSPYWYECYHWWGLSSDGTRVGALYNKDDRLVEIKAWQPWRTSYVNVGVPYNNTYGTKRIDWVAAIGNWSATNEDDFVNVAKSLTSSLGIPLELVSDVSQNLVSASTIVESGQVIVTTDVTLSSRIGGFSVSGANSIVVRFTDLNVSSIDMFSFYGSPGFTVISKAEAIADAKDFISSALTSSNVTILGGPWFEGHGLDQDSLVIVCILTATIGLSDWPYPVGAGVLLDAQTGSGISYRLYRGMPDIHYPPNTEPAKLPVPGMIAVACVLVAGTLLLFSWPPELLIVTFLSLLVPLFSRLKQDEVLDQYRRGMIHGFIIAHPGVSFSDIKKSLSIGNGTLVYHLEVLEKSGHILSRRSGNLVRYYTSNVSYVDIVANSWTELQTMIVNQIRSCGQCSRSEIRKRVGASRQTLHNNLRKLVTDHVLVSSFMNGRRYYRIAPGVDLDSILASS
jgi:DNA-binding transcriptional ArsR family regulator